MTYYEAKFERETKDRPANWIIVPAGFNRFGLVCIGPAREYSVPVATEGRETSVPYIRVVK